MARKTDDMPGDLSNAVIALFKLSQDIGEVSGAVNEMSKRTDEVHAAVEHVAERVEHLTMEDARQHQRTDERLGAIEARLDEGARRMDDHEGRLKFLEGKKSPDSDHVSKVSALFRFAKDYAAWLIAGGAFIGGLVYAFLKGGSAKP